MAATALFEPKTDSFGQLVLNARPKAFRADWARWSTAAEDEDASRGRANLFITIGFVAAFLTFLSGLYVVDSSVFPHGYAQSPGTTTASVDYD